MLFSDLSPIRRSNRHSPNQALPYFIKTYSIQSNRWTTSFETSLQQHQYLKRSEKQKGSLHLSTARCEQESEPSARSNAPRRSLIKIISFKGSRRSGTPTNPQGTFFLHSTQPPTLETFFVVARPARVCASILYIVSRPCTCW